MAYQLQSDGNLQQNMRRIASEQLELIQQHLRDNPDKDKAVHESRKAFKRLRAFIRIVRDNLSSKQYDRYNRTLRDAAQLLAPMRDGYVLQETLKDFKDVLDAEAYKAIEAQLKTSYRQERDDFVSRQDATIATVLSTVQTLMTEFAELKLDHRRKFDSLDSNIRSVYGDGQSQLRKILKHPDDVEMLHDWRKAVKYMWYQLSILQPTAPFVLKGLVQQLDNLAGLLGKAHDYHVLEATIRSLHEHDLLLMGIADVLDTVAQRRGKYEELALAMGQELYAEQASNLIRRLRAYYKQWRHQHTADDWLDQQPEYLTPFIQPA